VDVWEGQVKAVRSAAAWVKNRGPAGQGTAARRGPRAYYVRGGAGVATDKTSERAQNDGTTDHVVKKKLSLSKNFF
jgi:hypothetical protein